MYKTLFPVLSTWKIVSLTSRRQRKRKWYVRAAATGGGVTRPVFQDTRKTGVLWTHWPQQDPACFTAESPWNHLAGRVEDPGGTTLQAYWKLQTQLLWQLKPEKSSQRKTENKKPFVFAIHSQTDNKTYLRNLNNFFGFDHKQQPLDGFSLPTHSCESCVTDI